MHHSNYAMPKLHFIKSQQIYGLLDTYLSLRFYSYKMPGKFEIL